MVREYIDPNTLGPPQLETETSTVDMEELRKFVAEFKSRQLEALNLYEPMPWQNQFHACTAKEALLLKANQVGGSLANFVEIARAVTGQDPYKKYPKKDGVAVCVGYGERHIGQVIYRYLFRWGAFKIIRDEETGDWRTYHPWSPDVTVGGKRGDSHRKAEARPAPPLIPKRFIEGKIAWARRSADIFERVQFKNGWTLHAFNSAGDPEHAQGLTNVWLYDFDEDVAQGGWYEEAVQRTSSCNGFLRWNAMPHSKTEDIMRMVERGEEEEGNEHPNTVIIRVKQADNPYLDDKAREQNARIALSMGEDVYRRRILGELTLDSVRMYPSFDKYIHNVIVPMSPQDREDEANGRKIRTWIQKAYADNGFRVPGDWTRYVIIDPGHETCAAIFIATPPESFGDWRLQYDEIYIKKSTAAKFARAMKERSENQTFQTFIFDMHGGSLRGAGDKRWVHEYQDEFERLKIECVERGPRFAPACDNITFREQCLRNWMELRMEQGVTNGCPTYYIDAPRCPNTVREILGFKKKTIKQNGQDVTIDEANRRGSVHTVECHCDQTEVLTESGWKLFKDITLDERLGTVNLDTDKLEYQYPTRIVARPHSGEMIEFGGLKMNALVTPNHRMIARGRSKDSDFRFVDAANLCKYDNLKLTCSWDGIDHQVGLVPAVVCSKGFVGGTYIEEQKEVDPLVWAEFLGWYVSEGHAETNCNFRQNKNRVSISQSRTINPGKWARIKWILEQLPWKHYEVKNGFVLSTKQLHDYLVQFGKCYDKWIPDWVKQGSPRIINAFLSGAISGDGWTSKNGTRHYASSSKRMADEMQELFMKVGVTGSVIRVPKSEKIGIIRGREVRATCDMYWFTEWKKGIAGLRDYRNEVNYGPVQYEGMVYCATVPNGTLITRRDGKPLISGNCAEYAAAHGCRYVRPPAVKLKDEFDLLMEQRAHRAKKRRMKSSFMGNSNTITLGPRGE